jgi:EmrB/QacA subfamily drug resistance transporter
VKHYVQKRRSSVRSFQERQKASVHGWVVATVMTGTFMGGLDTYIVNVSLPTIAEAFGVAGATVQWVPLAYLVAITSALVIAGRAADLWGSRRVYLSGLLTFVLGSALCGAAPTALFLVVCRGVQGLGAAMLLASGQALLAEVFPEEQRGRAMACLHVAVALGFTLGPALGGLLVEAVSWRWVFAVNVPIGLLAAVVGSRVLPAGRRSPPQRVDLAGAVLLVAGLVLLLLALTRLQQGALASAAVLLAVGGGILAAFLLVERRAAQPMLDLALFRRRAFTAGLLATFLNFIAMASNMFLIPFFLQDQLLLTPSRAGLIMMAVPLTILWAAPVGGWLSDRLGPRVPATAGLLLVTATVVLMALLSGGASPLTMIGVLGLYGLGAGLFQSPNNSGVLGAAPPDRLGTASGTLATLRQLGQVAGIGIASTVWVTRQQAYLAAGLPALVAQGAGFRDAFLVLAGAGVLAVVASAVRGQGRAQASQPPAFGQEVSIGTPSDHITGDRSKERRCRQGTASCG